MITYEAVKKHQKRVLNNVVFVGLVVFIFVGLYTYTILYQPIQERLREEEQRNFELYAENKRQIFEEVISRYANAANALSSRSAIRDMMFSYVEGSVNYEEMIEFIEPRFREGVDAFGELQGVVYVARVLGSKVIIDLGTATIDVQKHIEEHLEVLEIHMEMTNPWTLCVISPIRKDDHQLGYDLILVDLKEVMKELEEERYFIQVLAKQEDLKEDPEYLYVNREINGLEENFHIGIPKSMVFGEGQKLLEQIVTIFVMGILIVMFAVTISVMTFSKRLMKGIAEEKQRADEKAEEIEVFNHLLQEKEETLRFINGVTGEGIWDWHIQEEQVFHNEKWCSFFGMSEEYLNHETKDFLDRIHPDDFEMVNKKIAESLQKKIPYLSEHRMTRLDGSVFWVKDRGAVLYDEESKQAVRMVGSLQDITQRKQAEEELYQEKELFRTTLLSVGDGVIATDVEGRIILINPVAQKLTGWTQEEALGQVFSQVVSIVHEKSREKFDNLIDEVLRVGEIIYLEQDMILVRRDGIEIPIEDSAAPIRDHQHKIIGAVIVFRDFREKKEKIREIEYLSFHDPMTGLYNRRYAEDAMKHMDTQRNLPFSMMILDVNDLKVVNDTFGHQAGDALIQYAAEAMKKACRADDIIARIGGDEFMVLLPRTSEEEATQIGRRIQKDANKAKDLKYNVSLAFGCATKLEIEESLEEIQKRADRRMYEEKAKMKNNNGGKNEPV